MSKIRNYSLLAGLAGVVILAAGWFLLVSPQRAKAADLRSQAESVRSETTGLQAQLATLKAQAKLLPQQRARLNQIAVQIPPNPAEPALVRALTKAADAAGVDLTSIAPAEPAPVVAAPAAAGAAATGAPAAGAPGTGPAVATIALKITAVGRYAELIQFQRNLEHLPRALKTTGISLSPGGSRAGATAAGGPSAAGGYDGLITASISSNVYMTVEVPSTAPLTGAAGAPAPTK